MCNVQHDNGPFYLKMDALTQKKMGKPILCPVPIFGSVIQWLLRTIPDACNNMPICSIIINDSPHLAFPAPMCMHAQLCPTCHSSCVVANQLSASTPRRLGTNNLPVRSRHRGPLPGQEYFHSRIMILGRWYSKIWMAYIFPKSLNGQTIWAMAWYALTPSSMPPVLTQH